MIPEAIPRLIIYVIGPRRPFLVRKKSERWGIWLNTEQRLATDALGHHAYTLSSPSLEDVAGSSPFSRSSLFPTNDDPFLEAGVRLKTKQGHYGETAPVGAAGGRFSATFALPDTPALGVYTVHALFLTSEREWRTASATFSVSKTGWARWVDAFDKQSPFGYALALLAVAVLWGWLAHKAPQVLRPHPVPPRPAAAQHAADVFFHDDEAGAGRAAKRD